MDNGKNSMNNDKSLCLYCDKSFSNLNDQENHVEQFHTVKNNRGKGSRKSERITKNSGVEPFQGCFYCNNRKLTSRCDDLEALFQHLLTSHRDVCYVCKCRVRLQNKAALVNHKKSCKLSGGVITDEDEELQVNEKFTKKRKAKKLQLKDAVQCDSFSESEETSSSHQQTRTNAMNKKSENRHNNSYSVVNRRNNLTKTKSSSKLPSSSSSTISSSSSSKASDEYTIPLTRQKLKDPPAVSTSAQKANRTTSNKKTSKVSSAPSSSTNLVPYVEIKSLPSPSTATSSKSLRLKSSKVSNALQNNVANSEISDASTSNSSPTKIEALNTEFDEDFYKNISNNIRLNLDCFIDGKADRLWNSKFRIDNSSNVKHEEVQNHEKEIHEATNFELTNPPFPALLTAEQYGFGDNNPNKNKRQFTKNSWKWRWDLIKKYKYVNEGGKIVKKVKQITTGLKDLSQLDMWTQLSMRSRYENLNRQNELGVDNISRRVRKTQNIEQLNYILDRRLTPEIHMEQLQQMLVKEELMENEDVVEDFNENEGDDQKEEILNTLQLAKIDNNCSQNSASLSGEWARPRCFICIDCGQEFDLMKSLNDHKNSEHPYVVSAHYEVVGRENLEHKLYKNLFLPKKALNTIGSAKSISINSDSKSNEASSSSQSSSTVTDQREKECTKCQKIIKYSGDIDIYRHILDCIEDKVWMQAKRRNKYRRSRRKPKKNFRKNQTRPAAEQKKSTSSPLNKDSIDGDNSTPSISEPPTPKEENLPPINFSSTTIKSGKNPSPISENFINNDERGNIKSFFRVSKTTPNLPQKMVVQMLQMPNTHNNNHTNNTLRHSLRSSARKQTSENHNKSENQTQNMSNESSDLKQSNKQEESLPNDANVNAEEDIKSSLVEEHKSDIQTAPISTLTSLHINTPEKCKSALNSPTNSTTSSLVSPTSCSSVPKKKKKLNDCIAMLTCKIQEKLGVNFFEHVSSEINSQENSQPLEAPAEALSLPTNSSLLSISAPISPEPVIEPAKYEIPEQEQVIDLSIKKVSEEKESSPIIDDKSSSPSLSHEPIQSTESVKNEKSTDSVEGIIDLSISQLVERTVEVSLESFKISIAREKIPELDEIIEKQNTINKLKISESERKAFEEQKNRIMQILGKKTPAKSKKAPKAPAKKTPKKTPVKKSNKKNVEECKTIEPIETPKVIEPVDTISDKPEEKSDDAKSEKENLETKPIENISDTKIDFPPSEIKEVAKENKKAKVKKSPKKKAPAVSKKVATKKEKEKQEPPVEIISESKLEPLCDIVDNKVEVNVEKKEEVTESAPEPPKPEVIPFPSLNSTETTTLPEHIEQVIKTTNRIRCRRLSVIVDPIIHLPAFQKNRKIRLTNNSQQNGFYDLLTNDQIFNAIKNTPQLKNQIQKLGAKKKTISEAIKEVKKAVASNASEKKPSKPKKKSTKYAHGKVMKVTKKKKKSAPKRPEVDKKESVEQTKEEEKINEDTKDESQSAKQQKGKISKASIEKDAPKVEIPEKVELIEKVPEKEDKNILKEKSPEKVEEISSESKTSEKIASKKVSNKKSEKSQPTTTKVTLKSEKTNDKKNIVEDEKVEPKVIKKSPRKNAETKKIEIPPPLPEKIEIDEVKKDSPIVKPKGGKNVKKIQPRKEKAAKNQKLVISKTDAIKIPEKFDEIDEKLDVSISSDSSNENDIPLAKLLTSNSPLVNFGKDLAESSPMVERKAPEIFEKAPIKVQKASKVLKAPEILEKAPETFEKAPIKVQKAPKVLKAPEILEKAPDTFDKASKVIKASEIFEKAPETFVKAPKVGKAHQSKKKALQKVNKEEKAETQKNEKPPIVVDEKLPAKIEEKAHKRSEKKSYEDEKPKKISELPKSQQIKIKEQQPKDVPKVHEETSKSLNDSYEIFSMNEDSFFNDDNDIDQGNDKINALVNNIINSSELIDSESEKLDDSKQKEAKCLICNKSFKNEKVLEKHKKTSTHLLKEKRKKKPNVGNESTNSNHVQPCDETKIFRTKGALKTFDNILSASISSANEFNKSCDEFKPIIEDSTNFITMKINESLDDDDEELSTKDKIFDSLFSNIENKLQAAAKNEPLPKFDFPALSPHDSESSNQSWDLKHDADIDWDNGNAGIVQNNHLPPTIANNFIKNATTSTPTKPPKVSKAKDTIEPTKSLIMGKIFKKNRDREKQKTPQADAPNNKPGIKNSLDEIFDHLKNSAEIDDKVLTCPSPKTLLKTFSPQSSHSNDMLETASQANTNNKKLSFLAKSADTPKISKKKEPKDEEEEDGIGKRKSRRRCAVKMKTFAETWSSDEYEELHDTNDIISIINEIEKRESFKKRKEDSENSPILKLDDSMNKKKVQLSSPVKENKFFKSRNNAFKESGHKSDDELKVTPKKEIFATLKKRRMSCFVPSTTKVNQENVRKKANLDLKSSINNLLPSQVTSKGNVSNVKSGNDISVNNSNHPSSIIQSTKKKSQKHRKRPRNKVKNIAYDSDSDFELNVSKKSKTVASNQAYSESESDSENEDEISLTNVSLKQNESTTIIKEQPKLLPNDLKVVVAQTTAPKAAIQHKQHPQQLKTSQSPFSKDSHDNSNRTKRHSSEKLYYWSSSSSDSGSDDIEQGDMPEGGDKKDSMMPQQPEQHGWIVGDSHKKLVTLLAHAKIKNKIN